jgi:hypothetical protein
MIQVVPVKRIVLIAVTAFALCHSIAWAASGMDPRLRARYGIDAQPQPLSRTLTPSIPDETLLKIMANDLVANPPPSTNENVVRVIGNIHSVGPEGAILKDAAIGYWTKHTETIQGKIVTSWKPGKATLADEKLVFVYGLKGSIGQTVKLNLVNSGYTGLIKIDGLFHSLNAFRFAGAKKPATTARR